MELADEGSERAAQQLADAIRKDEIERSPGLTREERYASVVRQLRRGLNPFTRRVLELIGENE